MAATPTANQHCSSLTQPLSCCSAAALQAIIVRSERCVKFSCYPPPRSLALRGRAAAAPWLCSAAGATQARPCSHANASLLRCMLRGRALRSPASFSALPSARFTRDPRSSTSVLLLTKPRLPAFAFLNGDAPRAFAFPLSSCRGSLSALNSVVCVKAY